MKLAAVIGGLALVFVRSLSVNAADMTPVAQPVIAATSGYIPARYLWSGFYLGAAVGGAFGTSTLNVNGATIEDKISTPFAASGAPSLSGFLVGGYAGINYQFDSVVIGAESDFTGTWANGNVNDAAGNNLQTKVFWTASLTGRLGYAFDRLLIYVKGGPGFAYDRDYVTVGFHQGSGGTYQIGWTAGGGVDYAFTEHWIARLEYDYFKFSTSKSLLFSESSAACRPALGSSCITGNGTVGFNLSEAKAAIAYKF